MEKANNTNHEELAQALESLERIADSMEEWTEQQRGRFARTTAAFRKKWISDWFSDFYILKFFKDGKNGRRFGDIVDTFHLYIPNIAESLKKTWNDFLRSVKFLQQIEKDKDKAEKSHDLGFWCVNFIDTTAIPTVERLRNIVKMTTECLATQTLAETVKKRPEGVMNRQDIEKLTRECSATQKQAETLKKRPKGVLNRQVGELLKSSPSNISASQIAGILNKNYVAEYEPTSPCAVGKTNNWKKHLDGKKKSLVKSK